MWIGARQRRAIVVLAGCAALVALLAAFSRPLARAGIVTGLAWTTGLHLSFSRLDVRYNGLSGRDIHLENGAGEPIADVGSMRLEYSLRDLLPGSRREFGLVGFDVTDAHLVIIRHSDGTFNVPVPRVASGPPASTPYVFAGRIANASVDVYDFAQGGRLSKHLLVKDIAADLDVATNARTRYRVGFTYVEDGRAYPVAGMGDVDVTNGFGIQRWRASRIPIARIAGIAIATRSLRVFGGSLRDFDARIVALPGPGGALQQHLSATAAIDSGRIAIAGLSRTLRNVDGPVAVYGDGFVLQNVNAMLGDTPIHLGGGVFGLTAPQMRLTVAAHGDMRSLRAALSQTARLPLTGPIRLDVALEGAATKPLVLVALRSPHLAYGPYAFGRTDGTIAFDGREADVIGFKTRYGRVGLYSRGRMSVTSEPNAVEILAGFDAPPDSLPYTHALAPGVALHGAVLATGDRPSLPDTRGVVFGAGGATTVGATFSIQSNGVGTVGPLRVDGHRQSLYAIANIDRPHDTLDAYVDASNVRLETGVSALPGVSALLPAGFAATLDSQVAGRLRGSHLAMMGFANLRDVRTPVANIAQTHLTFGHTANSPLAVDLDASGIGAIGAVAVAAFSFDRGTLRVNDAAAALRGTFADLRGSVSGVQSGTPRYDLWTSLHSVDVASLAAVAQPRAAGAIEGSAEARLHVSGSGGLPAIDGTARLPEGAVNGLPFHDLAASLHGTPVSIELERGHVGIGSTQVAFAADVAPGAQRLNVVAPHADLEDFNDFFDTGDLLGGKGGVRADVTLAAGSVVATSGNLDLHDTTLRGFDVGAARGGWHGGGDRIYANLNAGGPFGRVVASGTVATNGAVNLAAHARDIDLSRWLPMAGVDAPIAGRAQADVTAVGRYPDVDSTIGVRVSDGSFGRVPITRFALDARTVAGHGRISSATIAVPHALVTGSGTFGLRSSDSLGLVVRATTPNVATLANEFMGKTFDAAGSLGTTLRVSGTAAHPVLDDDFILSDARYGKFDVPRAAGRIRADERSIAIASSEFDLRTGRLFARGSLPIRLFPFRIDRGKRPLRATIIADDVEASNIADLLPKGTAVGGRIDGRVDLGGSIKSPAFSGKMTLAKGAFSGPQERVPISGVTAQLTFVGTSARLESARADAGKGSIEADGSASIRDLRDLRGLAVALNLRANRAQLDLPQYVKGNFDADLHLTHSPNSRPELSGVVAVDDARIPMTALYNPKGSNATTSTLPDVAMDLQLSLNRDVRVVSPNVDVGTQGRVRVTGTAAAPALAGSFTSTGGTVSFFRDFTVQNATITFDPSSGIVPDVDASATTFVTNPDTNVALRVTGPATHLNLAFASDPSYDREQILGLLVGAQSFGAVRGVQSSGGSRFSASSAVSNLAAGQVNTMFTRSLLEPLSLAIGGSLGLQNLAITNDVQNGLGINAVKAFGKYVDFVFADTFNEPRRESWSVRAHPSSRTQFELTAYTSQGTLLGYQPFLVQQLDYGNAATIPLDTGTNGIDVKLKRAFP